MSLWGFLVTVMLMLVKVTVMVVVMVIVVVLFMVNVLAIVYGLYSETPEVSKGSQKFILFTF